MYHVNAFSLSTQHNTSDIAVNNLLLASAAYWQANINQYLHTSANITYHTLVEVAFHRNDICATLAATDISAKNYPYPDNVNNTLTHEGIAIQRTHHLHEATCVRIKKGTIKQSIPLTSLEHADTLWHLLSTTEAPYTEASYIEAAEAKNQSYLRKSVIEYYITHQAYPILAHWVSTGKLAIDNLLHYTPNLPPALLSLFHLPSEQAIELAIHQWVHHRIHDTAEYNKYLAILKQHATTITKPQAFTQAVFDALLQHINTAQTPIDHWPDKLRFIAHHTPQHTPLQLTPTQLCVDSTASASLFSLLVSLPNLTLTLEHNTGDEAHALTQALLEQCRQDNLSPVIKLLERYQAQLPTWLSAGKLTTRLNGEQYFASQLMSTSASTQNTQISHALKLLNTTTHDIKNREDALAQQALAPEKMGSITDNDKSLNALKNFAEQGLFYAFQYASMRYLQHPTAEISKYNFAFHYAHKSGSTRIIETMLRNGADVNWGKGFLAKQAKTQGHVLLLGVLEGAEVLPKV